MKYTFFHIMALDPNNETVRLNDFLLKNSINSIDREFVSDGGNSFWSVCVVTHDRPTSKMVASNRSKNKQKIDYQEILSPEHYLNDIDRWGLVQKGVKAHCRYMDDFLFWSDNKKDLIDFEHKLRSKLTGDLLLKIKEPVLKRTKQPLLFCGIFIRPFSLKASKRRKQRYFFAWKKWESKWINNEINGCELQNGYASALAILLPAQENNFLRRQLKKQGAVDA